VIDLFKELFGVNKRIINVETKNIRIAINIPSKMFGIKLFNSRGSQVFFKLKF